ncbi:MAG TPA: immunoglobulin domain-containing protein, partial [Phycisphaerae bacterium]|nr:immunoglobulin domain-containing protein [Phycisphaerae bacterium]
TSMTNGSLAPPQVTGIETYNGELLVTGLFTSINGISLQRVARWDGSTWHPLGSGLDGSGASLAVFNGELIVGGNFDTAGGVSAHNIAAWNGTSWHSLGSGTLGSYPSDTVQALAVYQNELIAGGAFVEAGGTPNTKKIARWNGIAWAELGGGMVPLETASVDALTVFGGELFAAGIFDGAEGVSASNIAKWNGTVWSPVGSGVNNYVAALAAGDDELDVGGAFTMAGGGLSDFFAVWGGDLGVHQSPFGAVEKCPGESLQISAAATGTGPFTFQWQRNGVDLSDGGNIAGAGTGTLIIDPVSASDAADYNVMVSSPCGSRVNETTTLSVGPIITTAPVTNVVCSGTTAQLSVSASSHSSPTYQWRRNGVNLSDGGRLSGAATDTLTISPTQVGDTGNYDVVVEDTCGATVTSSALLTVDGGPAITSQSPDSRVCNNGTIALNVMATSIQTVSYQWRKDGANLTDGNGFSGVHASTLNIGPAGPSHKGTYDVVLSEACGFTTSSPIQLTVESAPQITSQPADTVACRNSEAHFTVGVAGVAPVSYQWRKDSVPLSEGGAYTGTHTAELVVSPATDSTTGSYSCVVTDSCNFTSSQAGMLAVTDLAIFFAQPESQAFCAGQSLDLYGIASGNPAPSYQWQRNGQDIPGATSPSYHIDAATVSDGGTYDLVAVNACGPSTSNAATIDVYATTGDGNLDTKTNGLDVQGFIAALTYWDGNYTAPYCAYDLNADAYVDLSDLGPFVNLLLTQ